MVTFKNLENDMALSRLYRNKWWNEDESLVLVYVQSFTIYPTSAETPPRKRVAARGN